MKVKTNKLVEANLGDVENGAVDMNGKKVDGIEAEVALTKKAKKHIIEETLDECLDIAWERRGQKGPYPNVVFVGEPGGGKTAIITQWAEKHRINLFTKKAGDLDAGDIGGALVVVPNKDGDAPLVDRFRTSEFAPLLRPRSVLFLDELNRAAPEVQNSLLTLINEHEISDNKVKKEHDFEDDDDYDPRKDYTAEPDYKKPEKNDGTLFLKNFLFTVAAMNPASTGNDSEEMGRALWDRMASVDVEYDITATREYLINKFKEEAAAAADNGDKEGEAMGLGRAALVDKLLGDKRFLFDAGDLVTQAENTGNKHICSPRSFEDAIIRSKGKKDAFLKVFPSRCGTLHLQTVKDILSDYSDNMALKSNEVIGKLAAGDDEWGAADNMSRLRALKNKKMGNNKN